MHLELEKLPTPTRRKRRSPWRYLLMLIAISIGPLVALAYVYTQGPGSEIKLNRLSDVFSTYSESTESRPGLNSITPASEQPSEITQVLSKLLGDGKSAVSGAAQTITPGQLKQDTRRPMKECIKPGNIIDDEVKGCVEGTRTKDW